jgi:hypothetical protein
MIAEDLILDNFILRTIFPQQKNSFTKKNKGNFKKGQKKLRHPKIKVV